MSDHSCISMTRAEERAWKRARAVHKNARPTVLLTRATCWRTKAAVEWALDEPKTVFVSATREDAHEVVDQCVEVASRKWPDEPEFALTLYNGGSDDTAEYIMFKAPEREVYSFAASDYLLVKSADDAFFSDKFVIVDEADGVVASERFDIDIFDGTLGAESVVLLAGHTTRVSAPCMAACNVVRASNSWCGVLRSGGAAHGDTTKKRARC